MSDFENRVFVFTGEPFYPAFEAWVAEQISAYPRREELIRLTALTMRGVLQSEQVGRHRMTLKGGANA
jgi:hypothetical protein